jgi:hypothetical protein
MRIRAFWSAVAVAGLISAGCASQSGKSASAETKSGAVNTMCPIGGHEVDTTVVRQWKGETIAFCCDNCTAKWDKMADSEKDGVLKVAHGGTAK